jgi:hypothetical protein
MAHEGVLNAEEVQAGKQRNKRPRVTDAGCISALEPQTNAIIQPDSQLYGISKVISITHLTTLEDIRGNVK